MIQEKKLKQKIMWQTVSLNCSSLYKLIYLLLSQYLETQKHNLSIIYQYEAVLASEYLCLFIEDTSKAYEAP